MASVPNDGAGPPHELAFEAFGVRLAVAAPDEAVLDRVRTWLPPGWKPWSESVEGRFLITAKGPGIYDVRFGERKLGGGLDLDLALELLDFQLRVYLGRKSRDLVFIH